MEIFKDIPDYEGLYTISNYGNIKKKGELMNSCIWGKYKTITLSKDKKYKLYRVHQLMAITFLDHKPSGHKIVVDHIDRNRLNNNLENLQLLTNRENYAKDRECYKRTKNSTSKYIGVRRIKKTGRYTAEIMIDKKSIYLGVYATELEAYNAYQTKLKEATNGIN